MFLCISMINQLVRRIGLPMSAKVEKTGPGSGLLTTAASKQVADFKTWHHAKILTYERGLGRGEQSEAREQS